jgi:hypothetical protein
MRKFVPPRQEQITTMNGSSTDVILQLTAPEDFAGRGVPFDGIRLFKKKLDKPGDDSVFFDFRTARAQRIQAHNMGEQDSYLLNEATVEKVKAVLRADETKAFFVMVGHTADRQSNDADLQPARKRARGRPAKRSLLTTSTSTPAETVSVDGASGKDDDMSEADTDDLAIVRVSQASHSSVLDGNQLSTNSGNKGGAGVSQSANSSQVLATPSLPPTSSASSSTTTSTTTTSPEHFHALGNSATSSTSDTSASSLRTPNVLKGTIAAPPSGAPPSATPSVLTSAPNGEQKTDSITTTTSSVPNHAAETILNRPRILTHSRSRSSLTMEANGAAVEEKTAEIHQLLTQLTALYAKRNTWRQFQLSDEEVKLVDLAIVFFERQGGQLSDILARLLDLHDRVFQD